VLVCLLVCTSACFLRNCPVGGKKRSQVDTYTYLQCLRCGPGGTGQCVGPRICCGYVLGCLIDTPETVTCQRENLIPTSCRVQGRTCGHTEEGNCVARGICC
ncbi:Isotocin-neurophysin IT 2, partial [Lamellibrachia satsuma]